MAAGAVGISAEYRLLGLVGQGQFSQVYCAIHRRTGRMVAIKRPRHRSAQRVQEPFVLHELAHPNVMGCKAIVPSSTGYQFILEYCEGGTLRSHLNTATPLPLSETKALIGDILKGLSHVHQQRIIHGDLKPENIFLTYTPSRLTAKIGDFSSACFVELPNRSRQEIGSPTYAAPERFEGESSYAADLYSVGVMLYEMLLGDRPFSGSPTALQQAHKSQPVPLPNTLTRPIRQLLATALHKQPSQRFASAKAMLSALQQRLAVQQVVAAQTALVPTVSIQSSLSVLSPHSLDGKSRKRIADPIEHLLTIPQGCCLITARSFYLLTPQHRLMYLAAFEQAQWIAVSPDGRWYLALPKQPKTSEDGSYKRLFKANSSTRDAANRPIHFQKTPLDGSSANIVQLLAIDTRHVLRIRSTPQPAKTYLECFTRRGQFVAQLSLNLSITQAMLTAVPHQLVAIAAPTETDSATVVLITLKPFTVKQLRLSITPQKVSALPWGYVVIGQRQALLLDRLGEPVSLLADLPAVGAIAAMGDHTILLSSRSPSGDPSTLFTVDFKRLDLGLIF